jgi:hypothetical protein
MIGPTLRGHASRDALRHLSRPDSAASSRCGASTAALPRRAWERSSRASSLPQGGYSIDKCQRQDGLFPAEAGPTARAVSGMIVPTRRVGMHLMTLCVTSPGADSAASSGRGASRAALPHGAWDRSSRASSLPQGGYSIDKCQRQDGLFPAEAGPTKRAVSGMIVATRRVGMHPVTLCVTSPGADSATSSGRGASRAALPRGAWERS